MEISAKEYLGKFGIDIDRITHRYATLVKAINGFIKKNKLEGKVDFNGRMLRQSVIDYFVDIVRIKAFHKIEKINSEKIYAYTAYWLFRRKPLQVLKNFEGCEYINELLITAMLLSEIAAEKGITKAMMNENPAYKQFKDLLLYNFKYRPLSQQSLELMIDAFFCGYGFTGH